MKTLILNPSREDAKTLVMLSYKGVLTSILSKVLRTTPLTFKRCNVEDKHVRHFISNIEPKNKALNSLVGRELENFDDALSYFGTIGLEIYGPNFPMKVLKSEIMYGPDAMYGLQTDDQLQVQQVREEMKYVLDLNVVDGQTNESTNQNTRKRKVKGSQNG